MLKNVLLASAAAFIVLGAAASLSNMKAVITSGNGAEASLTRDAFDMAAQMTELRVEQARQAALLSVQETTIRRLQQDLGRTGAGAPFTDAVLDELYTIGLDIPSPERERQAVDYHAAWLLAIALEAELTRAETRYRDLESETARQISRLETDSRSEIERLEQEIEQRDNSIVGLMHRLVSMQSGSVAPQQAKRAMPAPQQAENTMPAPPREVVQRAPAPQQAIVQTAMPVPQAPAGATVQAAEPMRVTAADPKPMPAPTETVGDGVAAYQSGDYDEAFRVWRALADIGDVRAWFYLGALYYEGRGAPRDLETARLFLNKAAAAGHPRAAMLSDRVASEMADAQVAKVPR